MQTSHKHQASASIRGLYHQHVEGIEPLCLSNIQVLENDGFSDITSQRTGASYQTYKDQFFTLDSSLTTASFVLYDSPTAASVSSSRSPFSPQASHFCFSDSQHSPDDNYGSPFRESSVADDGNDLKHRLRELEVLLLGPDSDMVDCGDCCFRDGVYQGASMAGWNWDEIVAKIPKLDLKELLIVCGRAVSDDDKSTAAGLMHVLGKMVSVSGDPIQRLGAYLLEGLRARLESSGSRIYRTLKCKEPTSAELISYMSSLFNVCPYYKFAYTSANDVIEEALDNESRVHIIDFQIAQGTQWMMLIPALAKRPGGPPHIRITGVDDSQSYHARGGGLHIVGQKLLECAESYNMPFEFYDAGVSACEVELDHLRIQPGEALAVNFIFMLHHMPDESVSTWNHRDRLLRLVKSLSPRVVNLVEQESNTNTSPFFLRYLETLDYYSAVLESIDATSLARDDRHRINAEQSCVARDIVNMVACEEAERVERHEPLGKWRSRFMMAGFTPYPLSPSVAMACRDLLKDYSKNYRIEEKDRALYLFWLNRAMTTTSAWR